jgi:mannose-6-phosphate isomerase
MRALRLEASFHPRIWGSRRLAPWFPDAATGIGEVWFTSDPPPPLLVKFLFTEDKLSVQVHPGGAQGKTEMWHVLRADPGASVAVGFRAPIDAERLRRAAESGEVDKLLNWVPVRPGDTVFVPAGTVHAIGAGLAICEIQQYSDTTYRLYDYRRGRELHLDEALRAATFDPHPGVTRLPVRCPYFETEALPAGGESVVAADLLAVLEGEGELDGQPCRQGEVWRLFDTVKVKGHLQALTTRVP